VNAYGICQASNIDPKVFRINIAIMSPMSPPVKQKYDLSKRREAAARTREAILSAALRLFRDRGYAATPMTAIAEQAGVALDTVYASAGRKPELARLLIETAISGSSQAVPAEERGYVRAIRAAPNAETKIAIYAAAMRMIAGRLAPVLGIIQQAAPAEPELAALWHEIAERRAANMHLFVTDLAAVAALRVDLGDAADIVWATNAPELYQLLVYQRGWTPERYELFLADTWRRLLLAGQA
jgi:AcrR family transcriptional regulator